MTITDPRLRRAIYLVWAVASLALGSVTVFCGASDRWQLDRAWTDGLTAVLAYLGAAVGVVAGAHTPAAAPEVDEHQDDDEGSVPAV